MPAVVEDNEQEDATVAFAVIATAVAGQVIVRPAEVVPVRVMLPAKLNVLVRETEIEPAAPELKFTGLPTEMVKSPTWETKLAL
jgi:hypothetical protein